MIEPHDYISDGKGHCATCGEPNPTFQRAYHAYMTGAYVRPAVVLSRYQATVDLRRTGILRYPWTP